MANTSPGTGDIVLGEIGECIYCGATDDLRTEHLIPFSLAGRHVLLRASCRACERKTSRWESKVAHDSFLPVRTLLAMPTRRPKKRPTSFPAKVRRGATWSEEDLDLTRMTAVAPFPKLPAPGAMDGRPLSTNVQTHGVVGLGVVANDGGDSNPAKRAGVEAVEIPIVYEPVPFMRMLAKIAWSYTVAQYGVDAVEPAVLGVVLGTDHNVAHYVGALDGWTLFDGPATADLHVCVAVIEQGWVLAGVRLFSNHGAPEYTVVVGRLRSAIEAEESGDRVSLEDPAEPIVAPA
jgi:hypothetical protein